MFQQATGDALLAAVSEALRVFADRAIYEETKIFFGQTGYKIVDLYATLGEYDFVSIIEVPDKDAIKHLFRRGVLAAGRGTFQVCTLPALPYEEFLTVVDDLRPPEEPARPYMRGTPRSGFTIQGGFLLEIPPLRVAQPARLRAGQRPAPPGQPA